MRQVARRLKDGRLELVEVPDPSVPPAGLLVRTEASVISAGTERATLEVARKGLLAKARARPDQARQVLERVRTEGLRSTFQLVRQRLDELGPLGYSAAGTVDAVGVDVRDFSPGDRVAVAGAGYANHAELQAVPQLLCAQVPSSVSSEDAAFATVGAIALHGFRQSGADLGSTVAVIGLGLIGQLAARIAIAAGCRVIGVDLDESQLELASASGIEAVPRSDLQKGHPLLDSADAVLVCASTGSSDPISLAAALSGDRATVVVVGDVGMEVPRSAFYAKELELRLSRSYGPGRYDPNYELHGHDYPSGYVRWTEQRNMAAFLDLVAEGRVRPQELVTHRFSFSDAEAAFEVLISERPVAITLRYEEQDTDVVAPSSSSSRSATMLRRRSGAPRFGLIGAGNFATSTLIPGLTSAGMVPVCVASATGLSAASAQQRFGFEATASSAEEVIARADLDLIVIATQHDSHAPLAALALEAGRAVYVEKPLALTGDGLEQVVAAQQKSDSLLVVGFNRRHSPLASAFHDLGHPRLMAYRVNASRLPSSHWTNDPARGGGRLLGEGCHFIDFLCDQAVTDPVSVVARGFATDKALSISATDNFSLQIAFADGTVGALHYAADAPTGPGKERFEVTAPGAYGVLDDFKTARIWRGSRHSKAGGRRQNKGFTEQFNQLARVMRGEADPPRPERFYLSTLATLAAVRSLTTGAAEPIVEDDLRKQGIVQG